jgi:hypothetical protein
MRGWLLYQDSDGSVKPDDYATERLQECAKSRGIELDVVRPANFDLVVTRDDRKGVELNGEVVELRDFLIPRTGARTTYYGLSDQIIRVVVRVGVAYGSDTRRAKEILLRVAADDHMVLYKPRPKAFFLEFGDSSLNLELRAFVKDIDDFLVGRDRLHDAIDDAFKKAGIEIAFPQRDIHVRSIHQPLAFSDEAVQGEERGIHPGSRRVESLTEGPSDDRQVSQGDNK